jgi:hypothetical protein
MLNSPSRPMTQMTEASTLRNRAEPYTIPAPASPKTRVGQGSLASMIKTILRPPLKAIYYTLRWTRLHKIAALLAVVLLLAGVFTTSYIVTGDPPFTQSNTISHDLQTSVDLNQNIKAWLLALRSGDIATMKALEGDMLSSADTGAYVLQFSEQYAHVHWDNVKLTGMSLGPDSRIDTFLELDQTETINGTAVEGIYFWHFTTDVKGNILFIDVIPARHTLKS